MYLTSTFVPSTSVRCSITSYCLVTSATSITSSRLIPVDDVTVVKSPNLYVFPASEEPFSLTVNVKLSKSLSVTGPSIVLVSLIYPLSTSFLFTIFPVYCFTPLALVLTYEGCSITGSLYLET